MKFKISKNRFLDVLSKIQGLIGRKSSLAITSTVLIKAKDSEIVIEATDLETGFKGSYPADVESPGIIALNAKKLYEIVKDFPSDEVQIHEIENYWIEIGNKTVEYHLVGMNPEEYPDIPQINATEFFALNSSVFKKMIERALLTGIVEDTRAHITGILFEKIQHDESKILRMVSTDGSRMALVDHFFDQNFEQIPKFDVLVPKKGLHEVTKFLDPETTVEIGIEENHFIVKKESETLIIRLLEGEFPKYGEVIEQEPAYSLKMNRQMFTMMLRRMSILSSDEYKGVIFKFGENTLNINSTNPDIGESKEDMIIEFNGEPVEIMFNPRFFIDTLNILDDETVLVKFTDETKPCILKGENDANFLSVVMPMKI